MRESKQLMEGEGYDRVVRCWLVIGVLVLVGEGLGLLGEKHEMI